MVVGADRVVQVFVLGIDPGLSRCGYGAVRSTSRGPRAEAIGVIRTSPADELPDRLAELQAELRALILELQPDVVADFSQVRFEEIGPNRVRVSGASGHARPDMLKATLGYRDGFIGEAQISYAGPGARARGELALRVLDARLQRLGWSGLEHRLELIGVNAMHGPVLGADREPYEVRVRLALRCTDRAQAERAAQEVEALYLNGPAGGGGVTQSVREVVAAASALIPRNAIRTTCHLLEL